VSDATRARLAGALAGLAWPRRAAIAAALGVAATLALPPYHATILLLPAFAGLALLIETAADGRRAFAIGWWFGAAHFAAGLFWIGHALMVDAARFAWMLPFAIGGLGAGLGLFAGGAALLAHRIARRARIALPVALAVAWFAAEWLRGNVLTGFPWNLIGTAWTELLPVAGLAALVGLYGVGILTVGAAACGAAFDEMDTYLKDVWDITEAGTRLGSLKAAFAHAYPRLKERYGHWFIFEHCIPFTISRAYDEITGIAEPRIWTAERDRDMWAEVHG